MCTDTELTAPAPASASAEMERARLGSILLSPEKLARVASIVRPADIENTPARLVYESILFLAGNGQPADPVLVLADLRQRGKLDEAGGTAGLMALTDAANSGENAEYYAARVADAARERRQRAAVENAYLAIQGGQMPEAVVAELKDALDAAAMSGGRNLEAQTDADIIDECLNGDAPPAAITTGYEQWDLLHSGGLAPGDVTVIGAAPSVGKSQFAINMETRMQRDGKPARILHVTMEMPARDCAARRIALLGHLNTVTTRVMLRGIAKSHTWETSGWAFDEGKQAVQRLTIRTIYGAFHPDDLVSLAARYTGRIDVMVVDYLQLVSGEKGQKTLERVTAASRACKQIAMTNDIHVIAISSLNRDGYRQDAKPTLSSLRETGNIEFDADNVWLLWRKKEPGVNVEDMEVDIVKQRNGPLDMLTFRFELTTGEITENRKRDWI